MCIRDSPGAPHAGAARRGPAGSRKHTAVPAGQASGARVGRRGTGHLRRPQRGSVRWFLGPVRRTAAAGARLARLVPAAARETATTAATAGRWCGCGGACRADEGVVQ
eukprot:10871683-Lingulodinium_polyedra.AAC.1